jgi:hypothetical protein
MDDVQLRQFLLLRRLEKLERYQRLVENREQEAIAAAGSHVLFVQTAGVTVANTLTETTLVGAGQGSMILPAGFFAVGTTIRITATGHRATTGTPTHRIRVKVAGTNVGDSSAVSFAQVTTKWWELRYIWTCRAVGVTGNGIGQGRFSTVITSSTAGVSDLEANGVDTIDTTGTLALDVTWQWGAADPANTITCTNLILEQLKV